MKQAIYLLEIQTKLLKNPFFLIFEPLLKWLKFKGKFFGVYFQKELRPSYLKENSESQGSTRKEHSKDSNNLCFGLNKPKKRVKKILKYSSILISNGKITQSQFAADCYLVSIYDITVTLQEKFNEIYLQYIA